MVRVGIFVGVDKSGGLQQLMDAAKGAGRMRDWAVSQGMDEKTQTRLITDAGGAIVTPDHITDAIADLLKAGADQLILYFAGHGVNVNRSEHWLLTEAPTKPYAAVNVSGSADLARYCGVQHVVIISDACRVAPKGIQAQRVNGVEVFPNEGGGEKSRPVDQFFACRVGLAAGEAKDPKAAADNYTALYTTALLDALTGSRAEVLEPGAQPSDKARYVKPVKLEEYLEAEVPLRIKALGLQDKVIQDPDALILAHPHWIACIAPPAGPEPGPFQPPPSPIAPDLAVMRKFTRLAIDSNTPLSHLAEVHVEKVTQSPESKCLVQTAKLVAEPFGPDHFETQCGIKVRGTQITDFLVPHAQGKLLSPQLLRLDHVPPPATNVLLTFDGGVGTLVPAFHGFLTALTFDEGELADIAYEPSANTVRGQDFKLHEKEVRRLRAVAAASSQNGRFHLKETNALAVAKQMQYMKGIDPTLSVYAAYSYHDLQQVDRIKQMSGWLLSDVGATLFDLELLARRLRGKGLAPEDAVLPPFPLLSQGWALLSANKFKLNPALKGIEGTMRESLWTLFDQDGVKLLRHALKTGGVL